MKVTIAPVRGIEGAPQPVMANTTLPAWFRDLAAGKGEQRNVKNCVPFMEAMTAGFVVPLPMDMMVRGELVFPTDSHSKEQLGGRHSARKFVSPWVIKTEAGVSCLFKQPEQRDLPFRIIEGIVDTDSYPYPVNFPFTLDPSFQGMVPKGTPLAQVIPFRREEFELSFTEPMESGLPIEDGDYRKRWWHRAKR